MIRDRRIRFLILIGLVLFAVLVAGVAILASGGPSVGQTLHITGVPCIHEVVYDVNGNGQYDQGEQTASVPGMMINVNDPQGPDSGHYAASDCYIDPAASDRTIHLQVVLPPGYRATSVTALDVFVYASAHFQDSPPHVILFVQDVTF